MKSLTAIAGLLVGCAESYAVSEPAVGALPRADGFDLPVGAPDGFGYHDAQSFGENHHLGDDWNGVGGGDSDLGDPVYAVAHGRVTSADHRGEGWGNTVRVAHRYRAGLEDDVVESFYAHLDTMEVAPGEIVFRGQRIGTIGNADGAYFAHLHFELRDEVGLPDGRGYSSIPRGWLDPTAFIDAHRPPPFRR